MVYIRASRLPALKEYKYSAEDHSLLSRYLLKPFYGQIINCFPISMAPNAITLTGFSFVVLNFITLLWYSPNLQGDLPNWVYGSWAIGLFLYQTFDAVDGSQARRTGQSGPLGELFDHGVDACNTVLEVLLFAAAMNLGQGWSTILTLFGATLTFYIQTWDEYYTKTLILGVISGPVEGILTLCIVYAVTALKGGGSFWEQSLFHTIAWSDWYIVYGGLVLLYNTVSSIQHVLNYRRRNAQSLSAPLRGLIPYFVTWLFVPVYLHLNPVILHHHLIPFVFYLGLVNAYSVGQIITKHLTKDSRLPVYNVLSIPLVLATIDSVGFATGLWPSALGDSTYQIACVFTCVGLAFGIYSSFVYDVITTICDYLDIWCLTIKHPRCESKTK